MDNINLDYYSGFEGENEIRLYANYKETPFRLNRKPNESGGYQDFGIRQGEFGIMFFSVWEGYFSLLVDKLSDAFGYAHLPKFIHEEWDDIEPWFINEEELNSFTEKVKAVNFQMKDNDNKSYWNFDCINDLLAFLEIVRNKNMELRISKE